MKPKEVHLALFLALSLALLLISGCGDDCEEPMVEIDKTCCLDSNSNEICDDQEPAANQSTNETETNQTGNETFIPDICGNEECEAGETCENCYQDCGACKELVYVYLPRNYTLNELSADINTLYTDIVQLKKDITTPSNISNFFYHNNKVPRYFADLMDAKYRPLYSSRLILLNHITDKDYYVNDTTSLFNYINESNQYITHKLKNSETAFYENRFTAGTSTDDYPAPPTGYQQEQRYDEWEYKNHTKEEHVFYNNITILDNGMAEARYSSVTIYDIVYKYHTYYDAEDQITLEAYKNIKETRMTNIHSLSFRCSRNLVITLYNYDFTDTYVISKPTIATQAEQNRKELINSANKIMEFCNKKYTHEVFTYE
jgi:hypothetical protein